MRLAHKIDHLRRETAMLLCSLLCQKKDKGTVLMRCFSVSFVSYFTQEKGKCFFSSGHLNHISNGTGTFRTVSSEV